MTKTAVVFLFLQNSYIGRSHYNCLTQFITEISHHSCESIGKIFAVQCGKWDLMAYANSKVLDQPGRPYPHSLNNDLTICLKNDLIY